MELKEGYQQTEVGVIPEDWSVSTVGEEFTIQLGKMLDAERNTGVAKPFLGNRAVQWGRIDLRDIGVVKLTQFDLQRFRLRAGDLLVCEGGAIGRAAIWDRNEECYYQKALHRLRPKRGYDPRLMLYVLQRMASTGSLLKYVTQTSIAHIPKEKLASVPIPLLPAHLEQRAIVETLTDADGLIESLEQLIAKKRLIKQGAMQELLAGSRRLPGFSEEWDTQELTSFTRVPVTDGPHLTPRFLPDGIPFLSVNNLAGNRIDLSGLRYISREDHLEFSRKCRPQRDDVLLGKAASVGLVAIVDTDMEFNIWSPIALIRVGDQHVARFVYYALQSRSLTRQIELLTNSSSQGNIGMADIETLTFRLPPRAEQVAIAAVLSDMDAELAALEARCDKTRDLKQGMMQELLTGRIRLV